MTLPLSRFLRRAAAAPRLAWKLLRLGRPEHLVLFGPVSYGDDLLCTSVLHELRRRGGRHLWMMSRNRDLFAHSPDVDRVVPIDDHHSSLLARLGCRLTRPYCFTSTPDGSRLIPPTRPMIAHMCGLAGITGKISLRPWLYLTDEERARGRHAARQIVMHSSGRSANYRMANKEWFPERFQTVADHLRSRGFQVIQLGATTDPVLTGALDLRGMTTLRESAAIVANAHAVVCQVGFLMHLARAVDTRAVVIYGGVEDPWISGYETNENIVTAVACATCWLPNHCPHARACMTEITADHVAAAVERVAARYGEPLVSKTYQL